MKKTVILLALAVLVSSCVININGAKSVKCDGPVEKRAMEVPEDFQGIEVNGGFDINMVKSSAGCALDINANNDAFEYFEISTRQSGNDKILVIGTKDNVSLQPDVCEISVSAPVFRNIQINGAGHIDYADSEGEPLKVEINGAADLNISKFSGPSLDITVNGTANMNISEIRVQSVSLEINGAGKASVSGEADDASFSVNGAGVVDATGLVVKNHPKVSTAGLASVKLNQ